MKSPRSQHPVNWKRHALIVSVVVTGASAFVPWGDLSSDQEQEPDHRNSGEVPMTIPPAQAGLEQEPSAVVEQFPSFALAAPLERAAADVGASLEVKQQTAALDLLDAGGPRKRSIASTAQAERGLSALPARARSGPFVEIADGVYQLAGTSVASSEPPGGNAFEEQFGSLAGGPSLPQESASADLAVEEQRMAIPAESSPALVAINQANGNLPDDVSRSSASLDAVPEAVRDIADAAEGVALATALAGSGAEGGAPQLAGNIEDSDAPLDETQTIAVDVPTDAVSVVGDEADDQVAAPMIASNTGKLASNTGSEVAQDVFAPLPDVQTVGPNPEPSAVATPGPGIDGAAALLIPSGGPTLASLPQVSLPVQINGVPVGEVPFLVDSQDLLSVSVSGLLDLVRPSMPEGAYEELRSSRAASGYVSFETLRKAGFTVAFDRATNRLMLSASLGENASD